MNEVLVILQNEKDKLKKNSQNLPMAEAMTEAEKLSQIDRALSILSEWRPNNNQVECIGCGS